MEAHLGSAIIALFDIFMQDDIFSMSIIDMFIMSGCMFIMFAQRLLLIIAVIDMRLHDIIMFMSAADMSMDPAVVRLSIAMSSAIMVEQPPKRIAVLAAIKREYFMISLL
jgi:hypothetical protein